MTLLLQLLANGLVNGVTFALLAVSFGLVYRSARVFHVAFGGCFVVSAYLMYIATEVASLPIWLGVILAVAGSAILGGTLLARFYLCFEQRRCSSAAVLVASLGLFILLENLIAMVFGNEVRLISRKAAHSVAFLDIRLTAIQCFQLSIGGAVLVALALAMSRVRALKAIWAMGDEPELMAVLGNPLRRYQMAVFGLATAVGAIPACFIGIDRGVSPHMGMHYLLVAAVGMLAGGTDRFLGWVLGGFVLAILHSVVLWKLSAQWMDLATFGVLIVILLFRPRGILGLRRRLEEVI